MTEKQNTLFCCDSRGGLDVVVAWCLQWYGEMRSRGGVVVLWFVAMEMVGPTRGGGGDDNDDIDGGSRWWWLRGSVDDWPESSPEMGATQEMIICVG
nr:hypothetical protein [Tanacetum cinerariifolium]